MRLLLALAALALCACASRAPESARPHTVAPGPEPVRSATAEAPPATEQDAAPIAAPVPAVAADAGDCTAPPTVARFAVVFLDQAPFPDEIYFLDDESLCGGEPRCPNALVTYTSSRITHAQCAWKVGSRCEIRSTETIMETPESPEVRRCWHYTIEVIAAPRKLGERGKIRLASRPGDNLTAPGPIEVLVAGSK